MISSFKEYLVEEAKTVYFTWGRMNPPTIGHGKLLDKLMDKSKSNPYRIYLTQSNDPKSNPLKYMEKIKTGSVFEVAEVLRDLYILKTDKDLSFCELKLLDTARSLLVRELAVARGCDETEIEADFKKIFEIA